MSRKDKLTKKLLRRPKDFTFSELKSMLGHFGSKEIMLGKTSGSRSAFVHEEANHIIRLHKPHPKSILKRYQIEEIIDELTKNGMI